MKAPSKILVDRQFGCSEAYAERRGIIVIAQDYALSEGPNDEDFVAQSVRVSTPSIATIDDQE